MQHKNFSMPKRGGANRGQKKGEEESENLVPAEDGLSTDDSSSEQYEVMQQPQKMELLAESVYKIYEQVQLDWPSVTVCLKEGSGRVLVEENLPGETPKILDLLLDFSSTTKKKVKQMRKRTAPHQVNRIRMKNQNIYAITDRSVHIYTSGLVPIYSKEISGGYGLSIYNTSFFYGDGNKLALQRYTEGRQIEYADVPGNEIFSVAAISEFEAFAATKSVDLVDFRSKETKRYLSSGKDINAIAYNRDNLIIAGDDSGLLELIDIRNEKATEKIEFHQSPISYVAFGSREVFASASSCEIVMWDTSYEETEGWDYHKYLSFVHQGESYYKDFEFIDDNTIIGTSENGLCIFSPKTEVEATQDTE